jgi:hypothetical protein
MAQEKITRREMDGARAVLKSTLEAVDILRQPAPAGDAFFQYETERRQDLLKRFAPEIAALETAKAKMPALPR